ncbi:amidohydrolase family protein [soil metagenome]
MRDPVDAPAPTEPRPLARVLADARLADGRRVDVHVVGGVITQVTSPGEHRRADAEVDNLDGFLLLPALAEPHAHVDKALTAAHVPNATGDLLGAIDGWITASMQGRFTHDDIVARSTRAMELLVLNGVTAVRSHVNVGAEIGTEYLRAVREARRCFDGILDVHLVALTASPMTGPDGAGNRAALREALEMGVDVVGGCPHLDPDGASAIADAIAVATEAGLGLDLHTDETLDPDVLELRELARQVIDTGFEGPVTASHCVSLGMQPVDVQQAVAREVAEAGISVVTLPQTNLFLQGRGHPTATPRGLTAIAALRDAGVTVVAGADNVQDPFNLMGRSDPLETAALLVMAGHLLPDDAYTMVSNSVRSIMGLPEVHVRPGDPADLLAIRSPSVRGAIADAPHDRVVYRGGRAVARSESTRAILR